MALPDPETLCTKVEIGPGELCVAFPGGAEICAQIPKTPPSLFEQATQLLGQANAALAPLQPVFTILEALLAVQQCFEAVKDALGPPPRPDKLIECLKELAEKMAAVAKLIPQVSVPVMIRDLIDVLIVYLQGLISELQVLANLAARIESAKVEAQDAPALSAIISCQEASLEASMTNLQQATAPVNQMVAVINSVGSLAGLPSVGAVGDLGADPSLAIEPLQVQVDVLTSVRDGIPV